MSFECLRPMHWVLKEPMFYYQYNTLQNDKRLTIHRRPSWQPGATNGRGFTESGWMHSFELLHCFVVFAFQVWAALADADVVPGQGSVGRAGEVQGLFHVDAGVGQCFPPQSWIEAFGPGVEASAALPGQFDGLAYVGGRRGTGRLPKDLFPRRDILISPQPRRLYWRSRRWAS